MVKVRAFKETDDNITEILTDIMFLFLIVFCFTLPHSEDKGANPLFNYSLKENIMVYLVIFSVLIISLIGKNN